MRFFKGSRCSAVTPLNVLGFDEVESGFRLLQSGKQMGKIVFKANPGAIVKVCSQKPACQAILC